MLGGPALAPLLGAGCARGGDRVPGAGAGRCALAARAVETGRRCPGARVPLVLAVRAVEAGRRRWAL